MVQDGLVVDWLPSPHPQFNSRRTHSQSLTHSQSITESSAVHRWLWKRSSAEVAEVKMVVCTVTRGGPCCTYGTCIEQQSTWLPNLSGHLQLSGVLEECCRWQRNRAATKGVRYKVHAPIDLQDRPEAAWYMRPPGSPHSSDARWLVRLTPHRS
jgi:hypothetical protein